MNTRTDAEKTLQQQNADWEKLNSRQFSMKYVIGKLNAQDVVPRGVKPSGGDLFPFNANVLKQEGVMIGRVQKQEPDSRCNPGDAVTCNSVNTEDCTQKWKISGTTNRSCNAITDKDVTQYNFIPKGYQGGYKGIGYMPDIFIQTRVQPQTLDNSECNGGRINGFLAQNQQKSYSRYVTDVLKPYS